MGLRSDGKVDRKFGKAGRRIVSFDGGVALDVAISRSGRIVMAGRAETPTGADVALAALKPNGAPDRSFSGDGKTTGDFSGGDAAVAIAFQSRRKFVIAGATGPGTNMLVARYRADGSPDG